MRFEGPALPDHGWSARQGCKGICSVSLNLSFEYQHDWKPRDVSGEPAPTFDHTHSEEVVFLRSGDISCLFFVAVVICAQCPILSVGTTKKCLAPSSSFPSIRDLSTFSQAYSSPG